MLTHNNVMTAPSGKDLQLTLFCATEGLSNAHENIEVFEGLITVGEICDSIQLENDSDYLCEQQKMQRDIAASRVNGIVNYLEEREDTVFPGITVFVSKLDITQEVTVGTRQMVIANIAQDYDRLCSDGQGRTSSFLILKDKLVKSGDDNALDKLLSMTLNMKLIVTNTATIADVKSVVRQYFADLHLNLKRPSTSLSLYFDQSDPCSRLTRQLLEEIVVKKHVLIDLMALNGKIKDNQIWTLVQFKDFITTLTGKTPKELSRSLTDADVFNQWLGILKKVILNIFDALPIETLMSSTDVSYNKSHKLAIFTKALFAKGLGYLGQSILDEAMNNGELNLDVIKELSALPLLDMNDIHWASCGVVDETSGKIIPKTDKKIGALLCRKLQVYPCAALMK